MPDRPPSPVISAPADRSGARLLVDALLGWGVRHSFGVPGESYLPVLDALRDSGIGFTVCRQEGGAAIVHLHLDPDAITPATTLTAIRAKALGG